MGTERAGLTLNSRYPPYGDLDLDLDLEGLLSRFSLANAYNIGEIDLFDYVHSPENWNATKPYFDYLERFLHFGEDGYIPGQAWPY